MTRFRGNEFWDKIGYNSAPVKTFPTFSDIAIIN